MEVQSLVSPIEMAGHPYNSAALPRSLWSCQRYINFAYPYYRVAFQFSSGP